MPPSQRYLDFRNACWNDHNVALRMLAEDPTLIDARSGLDETALHDCAVENGLEAVRFLLAQGAAPDPRNFANNSPLQECVGICRPEWDLIAIIELLLQSGADPYHSSEIAPCAWHSARRSAHSALRSLFAAIPPPAAPHEDCEIFDLIDDGPNDGDETAART